MNAPALDTTDPRPSAAPYPADLAERSCLVDGTEFIIRPIHPDDEALERAFICGLSRDSAYNRLLSRRKLSAQEIRQLTRIDYEREMAFVAVCGVGVRADMLGVARYVKNADGAEFALVVADAWQRRGLGTQLLGAAPRALGGRRATIRGYAGHQPCDAGARTQARVQAKSRCARRDFALGSKRPGDHAAALACGCRAFAHRCQRRRPSVGLVPNTQDDCR